MRASSPTRALFAGRGLKLPGIHPKKIRWKILAPYLALSLIVSAAGTYVATRLATSSLEERFNNQLAEAGRVTSDSVVRRERQHLATLRSIAFTTGLPEAVERGDVDSIAGIVRPLAANNRAEYVDILDASGFSLVSLHLADPTSLRYEDFQISPAPAEWSTVQRVFGKTVDKLGDKYAQVVQLPSDNVLFTAGPILVNGKLEGAIVIGSSLSSVLSAAKAESLADTSIYDFDGNILATTFLNDEDRGDLSRPFGSDAQRIVGQRDERFVYGRKFDFLYGDLRIRDQQVGIFSIALPSSFILSAASTARWEMAGLFGAATMAVLGIGLLIARAVTSPLLRLVRTAKAVTAGDLTARSGIEASDEVGELAQSFDTMTARLAHQHLSTIKALTSAIDARDPYTAGHSMRVGQLSVEIGRALELPRRDLQYLEIGGYLHDIGKIGIRDSVLLKQGALSPQERRLIEEHPTIGLRIIEHVDLAEEILDFVGRHHEKLDGSGYPFGLEANAITVFPRIGAIADIYDALTTHRPYRPALEIAEVISMMKKEASAGRLDEAIIDAFIGVIPVWERRLRTDKALRGLSLVEAELDHAIA